MIGVLSSPETLQGRHPRWEMLARDVLKVRNAFLVLGLLALMGVMTSPAPMTAAATAEGSFPVSVSQNVQEVIVIPVVATPTALVLKADSRVVAGMRLPPTPTLTPTVIELPPTPTRTKTPVPKVRVTSTGTPTPTATVVSKDSALALDQSGDDCECFATPPA